jgi:UMF1 family MFS transporter
MLPKTDDPTSYFSFYDVLEKIGLIIGPFLFATVNWITGGMRPSVLVVMTFFIIGFLLLFRVPKVVPQKVLNDGKNDFSSAQKPKETELH